MREMKNEDGLSRDDITKTICEKSGFEGVTNVKARSLYKYVAERGRPRKGN
jgi:hypothetical protein